MVKFLLGRDPTQTLLNVAKAKEVQMKTTSGKEVQGRLNISFADEISEAEINEMMQKPDI